MLSEIFRALGQPTRLGVVELLQKREMTVSEIADRLGADVSNVSKHLALLRGVGIVRTRKVGPSVLCTLSMPQLRPFLRCVGKCANRRARDEGLVAATGRS